MGTGVPKLGGPHFPLTTEIAAVLQPSAAGAKAVRGTYLKISAEKKAEIGQRAAEHGVLATVRYYATKLPVPLKESSVRTCRMLTQHNFAD